MLLAHLRGGDLPEIDGVGGVVGAGPNGSILQNLLEGGFGFREFLLLEIAIPDVAVGEKKNLFFGTSTVDLSASGITSD